MYCDSAFESELTVCYVDAFIIIIIIIIKIPVIFSYVVKSSGLLKWPDIFISAEPMIVDINILIISLGPLDQVKMVSTRCHEGYKLRLCRWRASEYLICCIYIGNKKTKTNWQ